jgi:cytochrome c551/c552
MGRKTLLVVIALVSAFTVKAYAPPVEEGKSIFMSRCASCHNVNKVLTGPALAGVHERRSIDWIISFVNSSQTLVKAGDKDAVAMFEKFNRIPMPDHKDLSADNIKNIVEFIKAESKLTATNAPFATPPVKRPDFVPISISKQPWQFAGLLASVLLLIATLLFAVKVRSLREST